MAWRKAWAPHHHTRKNHSTPKTTKENWEENNFEKSSKRVPLERWRSLVGGGGSGTRPPDSTRAADGRTPTHHPHLHLGSPHSPNPKFAFPLLPKQQHTPGSDRMPWCAWARSTEGCLPGHGPRKRPKMVCNGFPPTLAAKVPWPSE